MLNLVAAAEHFVPLGSQCQFQAGESRQARKILTSLNALDISRTDANFFCQFLLGQVAALSEQSDIFTKPSPVRISFGFARRHRQMLAETGASKHEAIPRDKKSFQFVS